MQGVVSRVTLKVYDQLACTVDLKRTKEKYDQPILKSNEESQIYTYKNMASLMFDDANIIYFKEVRHIFNLASGKHFLQKTQFVTKAV